jgi:hypothetical protein
LIENRHEINNKYIFRRKMIPSKRDIFSFDFIGFTREGAVEPRGPRNISQTVFILEQKPIL